MNLVTEIIVYIVGRLFKTGASGIFADVLAGIAALAIIVLPCIVTGQGELMMLTLPIGFLVFLVMRFALSTSSNS